MMNDLMEQAEVAHADCRPEIYNDKKMLKSAITHQREENKVLLKLVEKERLKTQD